MHFSPGHARVHQLLPRGTSRAAPGCSLAMTEHRAAAREWERMGDPSGRGEHLSS